LGIGLLQFTRVAMTVEKSTVTIKDVASRARVSQATASRALSGRGYVSADAREAVSEAARQLGYRPHAAARSLKLQRTNTIGLIITDIVNPFYSYLANGALRASHELEYHLILCATNENPAMEAEYLDLLFEQRVDGIIAVPTGANLDRWRSLTSRGTALVLVDRELPDLPEASVVLIDNVKGAYNAVNYLLQLGHRRIGVITGPTSTTTGQMRLQGYLDALEEASVPVDDELIKIGSFRRESGYQATHRLFSSDDPPTAIVACNNVLGEAAIFALRERDLRIAQDVSLIMFDDVPWASLVSPRVSVVAQPTDSLGFMSMELIDRLLKRKNGVETSPKKMMLQPELIVRESCMPYLGRSLHFS
jgi:LacI family transcriptional regulator